VSSLDCEDCDGAGCIPADHVREHLRELLLQLRDSIPGEMNQSVASWELIDQLSGCPITAGEAIFRLAVDLQRCQAKTWTPRPLGQLTTR
jgi:hypothetical protein